MPDWLLGDAGRLRQIVINLVGNAIKFTPRGRSGRRGRPQGQQYDHQAELLFCVADTGIGIPPDKLEKVFEAFEQADASTTRQLRRHGPGAGDRPPPGGADGAAASGWKASVGQGSRFYFTVRLELCDEPPPERPRRKRGALEGHAGAGRRRQRHQPPDPRGSARELGAAADGLRERGRSACSSCGTAFRGGKPFELLLSDVNMPEMDGFTLLEQVRRDPSLADIVTILLTSGDRAEDAARCQQLGVAQR